MIDYTARADGLKRFTITIKTDELLTFYDLQHKIDEIKNNSAPEKPKATKEQISQPKTQSKNEKKKYDKKIEIKLVFSINRDKKDNNVKK